ncbi:MAG: TonB-dependent receptor, partial [Proteobacteria bacterium]
MLNKLSIAIKTANQKSFLRKTALLTTSAATLAMMSMVPGVSAQEGAAPVEEIMITGIRGALKTAIDVKRNSEAVVDAISSEDIGKMPDKNVADSLSRVPGVQIQKGLTGEGSRVAIRGTDPELTYAVLNGQQVATTDWFVLAPQGRSFNFDLMPSEMVKGLEVYKSPMARLTEGGVGGTVIMNTRRPLELDANTFYASVEGNYTDLADESNASFGGLGSWKNSSETFGILAAVSSNKEAGIGNRGENYMSWGAGSAHFAQERERLALDVTAQFAPVEGLDIVAHYFSTETTADNTNHNFLLIPGRSTLVTASADGQSGSVIDSGGDPIWQNDIFYRQSEIKSDLFDLDAKYEGEGYTLHGQVGTTDSTGGTQLEAGAGFTDRTSASWDTSGNSVNLVPVTAIDTANMEWFSGSLSRTPREAEHTYGQFDVLFDTELGAVKSLETGIRATTYEYTKDKYAGTTPTTAT